MFKLHGQMTYGPTDRAFRTPSAPDAPTAGRTYGYDALEHFNRRKSHRSARFVLAEPLKLLQTYALPAAPPARAQTWHRIVSAGIFRTSKRPRRWSHSHRTRDVRVASSLQCKKFELCISRTNVSASEVCSSALLERNGRSFPAVSLIMPCCMAAHNLLLVYTTPFFCIQPQKKCKNQLFDLPTGMHAAQDLI